MSIGNYIIPSELVWSLTVIFGVLLLASLSFGIYGRLRPSESVDKLKLITRSWWFMALGITVVIIAPPIFGTILIAYVSFVALREMFSISGYRESDRPALFSAYFAIPIQYYLAYKMYYIEFICFIPVVMFIAIPLILVLTGRTTRIGRSMCFIPTELMLTVYMISHIVLLYNVEVPGFQASGGGLILYLLALTSFNDVFQYIWGKLLGKRRIIPRVSPNKTWAGFIGGILTTAGLAALIRFLTPLTLIEALIMGFCLGVMGFMGDAVMSAIKRDLELKDTDDLIPGHGGAMDRLDSIVITAPVFYYLLKFMISH